jgi:hypothetical protein
MLASCTSTEQQIQHDICEMNLRVTADFSENSKYVAKEAYFAELFINQLETGLPQSMIPVLNFQGSSDFDIKIIKAYGTKRHSSIAGNIVIELVDVSSGQSEILRGVDVSSTYWASKSEEDAFSLAISEVISLVKPKFSHYCGS